jgi:hypothetical protein
MKTTAILIVMMLLASLAKAQVVYDFEATGNGYIWNDLSNNGNPPYVIANPVKDDLNPSDSVLFFPIQQVGEPWAGTWANVDKFKVTAPGLLQVKIYKPSISNVGFKIQANAGNGDTGTTTELKIPNTKTNEWETIEYDYSAEIGKTFSVLAILPDFVDEARTANADIYLDDIEMWELAPAVPDYDHLNFENSGNQYTWNDLSNNGNPPYVMANPVKGGINTSDSVLYFPIQQDAQPWAGSWSAVDRFKIGNSGLVRLKVHKTVISEVGFKVEANAGNGDTGNTTELKVANTKVNEWEELEFDYSAQTSNTFSVMAIMPDFSDPRDANHDVYVDDVEFWKAAPIVDDTDYPFMDFETVGNQYTWNDLSNDGNPPVVIANPVKDGINTSDSVLHFPIQKAGQPWAGTWSAVDRYKVGESGMVHLKIYKPKISDIGFKVEANAGNGDTGSTTELKVANTKVNEWEEIEFDYAAQANKTFSVMGIMPDFVEGERENNVDIYVDDIEYWKLAAPIDNYPVLDFEVSGNNFVWTDLANGDNPPVIAANPAKEGLNTSDSVLHFTIKQGSDPWAGTWSNTARFKVNESGLMHMMVYKSVVSEVGFKVEANSGNGDTGSTTELKTPNTKTNEWEVLEFDFTAQANNTFSVLALMPDWRDARENDADVYIDNVEFWSLTNNVAKYGESTIKIYTLRNKIAFRGVDYVEAVYLYDLNGRLAKKYENQQLREIDINDLQNGLYIVKARSGRMITTAKVTKY